MASDYKVASNAGPNSKKNRWLRIQELHTDKDLIDFYIEHRTYGAKGTLALLSLRKLITKTIVQLKKGGL